MIAVVAVIVAYVAVKAAYAAAGKVPGNRLMQQ